MYVLHSYMYFFVILCFWVVVFCLFAFMCLMKFDLFIIMLVNFFFNVFMCVVWYVLCVFVCVVVRCFKIYWFAVILSTVNLIPLRFGDLYILMFVLFPHLVIQIVYLLVCGSCMYIFFI